MDGSCCSVSLYNPVLYREFHTYPRDQSMVLLERESMRSSLRRARSIVVIPALPLVHLNGARGYLSHKNSIGGGASGTQLDVLSIVVISPRCSDLGAITKVTQVVAREMMP